MWRRTYERLYDRTLEIEMHAEEVIDDRLARVQRRLDESSRKRRFWK